MRSMKWPPTPEKGRIPLVEGAIATRQVVALTLTDLQTNPFNDPFLSLGDLAFRNSQVVRARAESALKRLERLISIQAVREEGVGDDKSIIVDYVDREARIPGSVTIPGA